MIEYPKISVVTPSYNQGIFIEDAIQSVLEQNYPNVEHIVIDNCSTDGTVEILKKYQHLSWLSEPDKGQSDALNKGFTRATGSWILWLNADDYILHGAMKSFVHALDERQSGDYFYGDFFLVDENRHALRLVRPIRYDFNIILHYGPYIPTSGSFFSRGLIEEGLRADFSHRYNMDRKLLLELGAMKKRFVYLGRPVSCFRIHRQNTSRPSYSIFSSSKRLKEQTEEADRVYYFFASNHSQEWWEKLYRKMRRISCRMKLLAIRTAEWRFSKREHGQVI